MKNYCFKCRFCSLGNFDSNSQDDTHNLKDIDLAIVKVTLQLQKMVQFG